MSDQASEMTSAGVFVNAVMADNARLRSEVEALNKRLVDERVAADRRDSTRLWAIFRLVDKLGGDVTLKANFGYAPESRRLHIDKYDYDREQRLRLVRDDEAMPAEAYGELVEPKAVA